MSKLSLRTFLRQYEVDFEFLALVLSLLIVSAAIFGFGPNSYLGFGIWFGSWVLYLGGRIAVILYRKRKTQKGKRE